MDSMSTLGIIRPKSKLKCEHAFNKASKFNTYIFNDIASASRVLCPSAFRENVLCPLEGLYPWTQLESRQIFELYSVRQKDERDLSGWAVEHTSSVAAAARS